MDQVCTCCTRTLHVSLFRERMRKCGVMRYTVCKQCESGAALQRQRKAEKPFKWRTDAEVHLDTTFRAWPAVEPSAMLRFSL